MIRIIQEAQDLNLPGAGIAFADFLMEDESYIMLAVDLRSYKGPRAEWAKDTDVVYCSVEDCGSIFQPESEKPDYGVSCWDWAGYCGYINRNIAS